MELANELKKIIRGEVLYDDKTREAYSHDTSLFEIKPEVVVVPCNKEDIRALVSFATERDEVSLTARSGGTDMTGGALSESVVVDFSKHINAIKEVTKERGVVEPGAFYRDFEKETLKHNRIMPSYPASREICCIGGMVANNAGGERTLKHGKTIDYVEGLEVILSDGNLYKLKKLDSSELKIKTAQQDFEGDLYRKMEKLVKANYELLQEARPKVSKNSAGYYLWDVWNKEKDTFDLTKVIVGSQGTLGLVTEATFRLIEPRPFGQMMIVFLDSFEGVGDLVETVLKHDPTTFESYDDKTLKLATKFAVAFIKRLGVRNIFTLIWKGIPEALSIMRYGFPKLVLQITFRGDSRKGLREKALKLEKELRVFKPRYTEVVGSDVEADEYWLVRRESFNLLRHKIHGRKTAPFVDDISVRPEVLPEFFPRLNAIFEPYKDKMMYNIAGHIGDGNFHIIPLMDLSDESARAVIPEVAQKVYDLVLEYKGSITGEHNDGIIRTPFLRQQFGDEVYGLFEETKRIFDPKNIFNPGKKVPSDSSGHGAGTMEYAVAHMKKHN